VLFLIHLSKTALVIKYGDTIFTTTQFLVGSQNNREISYKLSRYPSELHNGDILILQTLDDVLHLGTMSFFFNFVQ